MLYLVMGTFARECKRCTIMIGLIGGTFDPIHFGHLRPALEIAEQLSLKEVRFIPSATPPHRWQPEANAGDRLEMVKRAIKGTQKFVLDDREYKRDGASYTVDTLKSIRNEIGSELALCMILGLDAFQSFTQWRDWQGILDLTHLVVSSRPGYIATAVNDALATRVVTDPQELQRQTTGLIYFAEVTQLDISATFIRQQRSMGRSAVYLTPDSVNEYIERNKLYET